jgi:excinuclease ABC subunit A
LQRRHPVADPLKRLHDFHKLACQSENILCRVIGPHAGILGEAWPVDCTDIVTRIRLRVQPRAFFLTMVVLVSMPSDISELNRISTKFWLKIEPISRLSCRRRFALSSRGRPIASGGAPPCNSRMPRRTSNSESAASVPQAAETTSRDRTRTAIELRGVRVHNLQSIDVDIPLKKLTVITGVSGSGKSSLAFDTLYAESQRRYIESFSTYARQYLERLDKPDADRIDYLPPAIALRQRSSRGNRRSTVATATEILDDLRVLFARFGTIVCSKCRIPVQSDTPDGVVGELSALPAGTRFQVGFPLVEMDRRFCRALSGQGFTRAVVGETSTPLDTLAAGDGPLTGPVTVILDRLAAGSSPIERIGDSVEQAFARGGGTAVVLVHADSLPSTGSILSRAERSQLDGEGVLRLRFHSTPVCSQCGAEFQPLQPRLFSYNSPLGACDECHGFGLVPAITFEKVVPDPRKTVREGAIAPWTTPAYEHELHELIALADDYDLPVDVPFSKLAKRHRDLIMNGVPEREFGGLRGFFRWLERKRYKMHVAVFLSRWRDYVPCRSCGGQRLNPAALGVRLDGRNIAEVCQQTVAESREFLRSAQASLTGVAQAGARYVWPRIDSRLRYLEAVGLGYLSLDRPLNTLSGGEAQRVSLTAALGSHLVNTLFVLDEPSIGLHPRDTGRLLDAIRALRDAGNTVVVVEHERAVWQAADVLLDIGPGAGRNGGQLLFAGPISDIPATLETPTTTALRSESMPRSSSRFRRDPASVPRLRLTGSRHHNLRNVSVAFPLQSLCVVTGVSGSGKSSLVHDTLYPAVAAALGSKTDVDSPGEFDSLTGVEHLDAVMLIDQSPIGRTPRSNPATYLGVFDDIRKAFAATGDASARGYAAGHFSFNSQAGGRCDRCEGAGSLAIDMQFLPDVLLPCPECNGARFRREILDVKLRGLNVAEVLSLTVREAFAFCRGMPAAQRRLKSLIDVGLEYIQLGQSADTLSGGESQRLKLAEVLAGGTRSRTLFLLDEPTTGLHPRDVSQLLECFQLLLSAGHSLIVVEHHVDVILAADEVIDLGPEAGSAGGRIVAQGAPLQIAQNPDSLTGRFLGSSLFRSA